MKDHTVQRIIRMFIALSCCSVALISGCQTMENNFPLKEEPEVIERYVLKFTALGSGIAAAEQFCRDQQFEKCSISRSSGFLKYADSINRIEVGKMHIRGFASNYPMGENFIVTTSVFWGFDESEKLIDVWVWKTIDGP
jgi:hypothetical protein